MEGELPARTGEGREHEPAADIRQQARGRAVSGRELVDDPRPRRRAVGPPEDRAGVHLRNEEGAAGHGCERVRRLVLRLQIDEKRRAGLASVRDPDFAAGSSREERTAADGAAEIAQARLRTRSEVA